MEASNGGLGDFSAACKAGAVPAERRRRSPLSALKTVHNAAASCEYDLAGVVRDFRGSRPLLIKRTVQIFQSNFGPIQERDK
jgi:hypothetical protein